MVNLVQMVNEKYTIVSNMVTYFCPLLDCNRVFYGISTANIVLICTMHIQKSLP